MMKSIDQDALLAQLAEMPMLLKKAFAALPTQDATWRASGDTFAPIEQCWHLADLERDGFTVRIRRLLSETAPVL